MKNILVDVITNPVKPRLFHKQGKSASFVGVRTICRGRSGIVSLDKTRGLNRSNILPHVILPKPGHWYISVMSETSFYYRD